MNPVKIYLDTSVPSAPFDLSKPLRNHITKEWFAHDAVHFELYISSLTIQELNEWSNLEKRTNAFLLLEAANVKILDITDTMQALAEKYITLGAIPSHFENKRNPSKIVFAFVTNRNAFAVRC